MGPYTKSVFANVPLYYVPAGELPSTCSPPRRYLLRDRSCALRPLAGAEAKRIIPGTFSRYH